MDGWNCQALLTWLAHSTIADNVERYTYVAVNNSSNFDVVVIFFNTSPGWVSRLISTAKLICLAAVRLVLP
jgi:hypothetical protein